MAYQALGTILVTIHATILAPMHRPWRPALSILTGSCPPYIRACFEPSFRCRAGSSCWSSTCARTAPCRPSRPPARASWGGRAPPARSHSRRSQRRRCVLMRGGTPYACTGVPLYLHAMQRAASSASMQLGKWDSACRTPQQTQDAAEHITWACGVTQLAFAKEKVHVHAGRPAWE